MHVMTPLRQAPYRWVLWRLLLRAALCSGLAGSALAQTPREPAGIFCSCPPTTATGSSVLPSVAALPYVRGFLVRIAWKDVEPRRGEYAWTRLDAQFDAALAAGKQVALAVVNGDGAPGWLDSAGAARFPFLFRGTTPAVMPVPWDSVYLDAWSRCIAALGARYAGHPALALVHMTHASGNGFEMQLPSTPTDQNNWRAIGYSHRRMIDSWTRVVEYFNAAFPATPLDVDLHPVLNSDSVSIGVDAAARRAIGARYGAFAAWWCQTNTLVYAGQYALLRASADSGFAGVQMVASGGTDSAKFGAGGMPEALALAVRDGIFYWEIWNQDLLNPLFADLLRSLAGIGTGIDGGGIPAPATLQFPQPLRPGATVALDLPRGTHVHMSLLDAVGRCRAVLADAALPAGRTVFNLPAEGLPSGLYILRLRSGETLLVRKALLLR
jgi:hypothetical protein